MKTKDPFRVHIKPPVLRVVVDWIKSYILFHNKRHPNEMDESDVSQFLSYLAISDEGESPAIPFEALSPQGRKACDSCLLPCGVPQRLEHENYGEKFEKFIIYGRLAGLAGGECPKDMPVLREFHMRIIFFAGKGGVGKTSVAAATGIKAAEMGHRTIIMSLDVAHSLSDVFDLERGLFDRNRGNPIKVSKNLWVQELDIQEEIIKNWEEIYEYISILLYTTGLDEILAEELAILPGMEEVSLLMYINLYFREDQFDVIILDCAPTGESLRFISIPMALEWYIKKIFKVQKNIIKIIRPLAKRMYDIPMPGDQYFDAIEYLFERLRGVNEILVDPEITTVRLVTNPEKIVLKETQRAFMYFHLYKMKIDGIIMNRILPDDVKDRYFRNWRESQRVYLEKAEEYFSPIPIFHVNLLKDEVFGYSRLKTFSDQIYEGKNPLERFFKEEPYDLIKEDGEYRLIIKLPFIMKEDVELNKSSDELIVRLGGFKRHILLPRQVASSKSVKAKLEGQKLCIYFKGDHHGKRKGKK